MDRLRIVVMLLLALGLSGCAAAGRTDGGAKAPDRLGWAEHEKLGDSYARQGRYEAAYLQYGKAAAGNPENVSARFKRGGLLLRQDLYEQALAEYQAVLAKDPGHAAAHEGAGRAYFLSGLYDEAVGHLRRALELDPGLWRPHAFIGVVRDRRGDHAGAAAQYETALALKPPAAELGGLWNNLGMARFMAGDNAQAVEGFRQAIRNGAPRTVACNNLGLAMGRMGRYQESLEAFLCAGDEAAAHNNLGYVLFLQGEHDLAMGQFEKAIDLSPTFYVKAYENMQRARMSKRFQGEAPADASGAEVSRVPSAAPVSFGSVGVP